MVGSTNGTPRERVYGRAHRVKPLGDGAPPRAALRPLGGGSRPSLFTPRPSGPQGYDSVRSYGGGYGSGSHSFFASLGFNVDVPLDAVPNLTNAFEESVWFHAGVRVKEEAVQEAVPRLWNGDPEEQETEVVTEGDLARLLTERPNKLISAVELFGRLAVDREQDGSHYWFLSVRGAGGKQVPVPTDAAGRIARVPDFIVPVPGGAVSIDYDDSGAPTHYAYKVRSGEVKYPADAVVPFRLYDPRNPFQGLGTAQVLARKLQLAFKAERLLAGILDNGGDGGGIVTYDADLGPDEMSRRQAVIEDQMGGGGSTAWHVADKGAKYDRNPNTPDKLQYQELDDGVRDAVLGALRVPPPCVGVWDNATYNNLAEAKRALWTMGILPVLRWIERTINEHFIARLRVEGVPDGIVFGFDTENVEALRQDSLEAIKEARELARGGVGLSLTEALTLTGVEFDERDYPEAAELRTMPSGFTTLEAFLADPGGVKAAAALVAAKGAAGADDDDDSGDEDEDDEPTPPAGERSASTGEPTHHERSWSRAARLADEVRANGPLTSAVASWLADYERAQVRHLEAFAAGEVGEPRGVREMDPSDWAVASGLSHADIAALNLNAAEWGARLDSRVRAILTDIFEETARETAAFIGADGTGLTGADPRVRAILAEQRIKLVEGVTSTVAKRVRKAILSAYKDDHTIASLTGHIERALPELTKALQRVFRDKEARAQTIARTETGHASNTARVEQARSEGVGFIKWVTAGATDPNVRPTHRANDGLMVPVGGTFPNGLRYPHDPEGPAGEVINCRCTPVPVVED